MKKHEAFEIVIEALDVAAGDAHTHEVRVKGPGGVESARVTFFHPEVDPWLTDLAIVRGQDPNYNKQLEVGGKLFQVILGEPKVNGIWAESVRSVEDAKQLAGMRILLQIEDPQLAMLPWELLYDHKRDFLATAGNLALARYYSVAEPPKYTIDDQLNVLLVVSSPKGHNIDLLEVVKLEHAIRSLDAQVSISLETLQNKTMDDIRKELQQRDYHVLHFLGHGRGGKLAMTEQDGESLDRVSAEAFAGLFQGRPSLRLVVLNSCHSSQSEQGELFSGIGPALVKKRIPAVVAMQYATILTSTTEIFNRAFYGALANGRPVDFAVNEGRSALASDDEHLQTRDWSTPVLYLATRDGDLLGIRTGEEQLEKLLDAAGKSPEAKAALLLLGERLRLAERRAGRLPEWLEIEDRLRSLQQSAESFNKILGAGLEDVNVLEYSWATCESQLTQLRNTVARARYLTEDLDLDNAGHAAVSVAKWSKELDLLGEGIEKLIVKKALDELVTDSRSLFDKVRDCSLETSNALRREAKALGEDTLRLAERYSGEE